MLLPVSRSLLTLSDKIELVQLFGDVITDNSQRPCDGHVTFAAGKNTVGIKLKRVDPQAADERINEGMKPSAGVA